MAPAASAFWSSNFPTLRTLTSRRRLINKIFDSSIERKMKAPSFACSLPRLLGLVLVCSLDPVAIRASLLSRGAPQRRLPDSELIDIRACCQTSRNLNTCELAVAAYALTLTDHDTSSRICLSSCRFNSCHRTEPQIRGQHKTGLHQVERV